jgi:hypothetical protein
LSGKKLVAKPTQKYECWTFQQVRELVAKEFFKFIFPEKILQNLKSSQNLKPKQKLQNRKKL